MDVANKLRKIYRNLNEEKMQYEGILITKKSLGEISFFQEELEKITAQMDFIKKSFEVNGVDL